MAVKAEVKAAAERVHKYPKLMKSTVSDLVVLFNEYGSGTVVVADAFSSLGAHEDTYWDMDVFEDFHGSITLSND